MLADRAQAMQRVCFGSKPSDADLEFLGSPERWLVYRELVQNRLLNVIGVALARTKLAIGEERFGRSVAEWFSTGGPKTRYLRHIPFELVDFALPVWRSSEAPWVADLARFEVGAWKVRHAASDPLPEADFAFDRKPVLGTGVQIFHLDYPVHLKPTPALGYEPLPTVVCVYRDSEHKASLRELNPLAASLLENWRRGEETVADSVHSVAASHKAEIGPAFVEKLSSLIADFIERGILLGGTDA